MGMMGVWDRGHVTELHYYINHASPVSTLRRLDKLESLHLLGQQFCDGLLLNYGNLAMIQMTGNYTIATI